MHKLTSYQLKPGKFFLFSHHLFVVGLSSFPVLFEFGSTQPSGAWSGERMGRISRTAVRELATAALQLLGLVQALRALRSLPHLLLVGSTSPLAREDAAARGGSGRRALPGAAQTSAPRTNTSRFPMFALHRLQHPQLTNPPQHSPHVLHRHRPAPPHRQPGPRAAATLRARTCAGGIRQKSMQLGGRQEASHANVPQAKNRKVIDDFFFKKIKTTLRQDNF